MVEITAPPARRADDPPAPVRTPRGLVLVADWTPLLVLAVLVAFAAWTLAYQVALVTGLHVVPTVLLATVVFAGLAVLLSRSLGPRRSSGRAPGAPVPEPRAADRGRARMLVPGALVATAVAAALALAGLSTAAVMVLVLAALTATVVLVVGLRRRPAAVDDEPAGAWVRRVTGVPSQPALWLTGWVLALASGAVAALYARPDGDDAYFVNLSTWVGQRGTFPLRDTMFSDQVFPALHSHTPPVHSVEGLMGAIARLVDIAPATVVYVVAPAPLTALAVLALTYAIAVCRIPHAPVALVAAVVSLLCSGANGASFGNFWALRMWQGKSMFVSIVAPLLLALGVRYVRSGGGGRLLALGLAVVAAIGASNTSIMLVPIALAGLVPAAWAVGGLRRAAGVLVPLAYPLAGGAVMALAAPSLHETGTAVSPTPLDPVTAIPGLHGMLLLSVLAVGLGWLGVRGRPARAVVAGTLAVFAVAVFPPVTKVLDAATGADEVLWRLWWVVPVPLLIGGLAGALSAWLAGLPARGTPTPATPRGTVATRPTPARPAAARPAVVVVAGVVAASLGLLPLWGGFWLGDPRNANTRRVSPTAWKVPKGAQAHARYIASISRPGDVVLAPWYASRVLAATTVAVHAIAPRTMYLTNFVGNPEVHPDERAALQQFADSRTVPAAQLAPELRLLSVDTVCVATSRGGAVRVVEESGFRVTGTVGSLTCLRR
jgi:hypothetical protein